MIKKYRFLLFFYLVITAGLAHAKSTYHFEGKAFKATIDYDCSEGNVSCNKLHLTSTKIKDNSTIKLSGETINVNCPDVCDFRGYRFKNGKYMYSFYPSLEGDDLWSYIVTLNEKVIAKDSGTIH